ncbi:YicC family protein [candidate division LCP-89 bacterium B3_LCP]|uniref:YicC family protein n=1 Tax=candidate division LCP-89 bacterium B3_LCP TaxID=2012998 RepID=A0A532V0G2_UNCL8|nr:MAG: YicC family protein [candidate division LCP-89 bacterium B3_LCP]
MDKEQGKYHIGSGIASMTGFGRCEKTFDGLRITVEIRSVNNRHCDIGMRIPRELNPMESAVRDLVRKRIYRGKINLLIVLEYSTDNEALVTIDFNAADTCHRTLKELQQKLAVPGQITMTELLHFADVFTKQPERALDEDLKARVLDTIDAALSDLIAMRRSEGSSLAEDLIKRVREMVKIRSQIEGQAKEQPQKQMEKLLERMELLVSSGPLDPGRLEQEMGFMADRLDITEECVRLESHNQQFLETIAGEESAGKRLGFLLQEMNREANTISSKAALPEISHLAVSLKEEIERAREQIQNLE